MYKVTVRFAAFRDGYEMEETYYVDVPNRTVAVRFARREWGNDYDMESVYCIWTRADYVRVIRP